MDNNEKALQILADVELLSPQQQKPRLVELSEELLKEVVEPTGECLIHKAAQEGWLSQIPEKLITEEILTTPKDASGWTPLHHAALYGWWHQVPIEYQKKYLHGLQKDGWTPYHLMAAGNPE